jgi:hypothetical protein
MIRPVILSTALVALLLAPSGLFGSQALLAAQQSGGQVTAADAAPFIGDWTLTLEGQNGPAAFDLAVKVEKDKVVGEITHPGAPARPITDVSKADRSLVMSYSFDYEGNAVDAVVRMTPADEGKTNAEISFAGGAYVMSGTAAKKETAK